MNVSVKRPNVLLIVADDLGYGDLACYGNPRLRTPHLDRLAAEGVSLSQHYSASPLCAPARAALLTGRYNHRSGAVDVPSNRGLDRIELSERTLADVFAAAGYATGMVGKWHTGLHDLRYHPNARGFAEFAGFLNGGMDYWNWTLDYNGRRRRGDGRYLTDVFTDEAVDFLRRHRDEPFFLHLAYNAPHNPLQAPEALIRRYREENAGELNDAVCRLYAMIESMDAGIGRVLETLDRQGRTQDTIVVFCSDNGPVLRNGTERYNGPFRGQKGFALEGGIRVPAIVRYPANLPADTWCNGVVHFNDYLPTLAGMCGVALPCGHKKLDGFDVTRCLRGEEGDVPEVRFWQRNRYEPVPRCNGAMRDGPWKLLWPLRGTDRKDPFDGAFYQHGMRVGHWLMPVDPTLPEPEERPAVEPELYNLDDDPGEEHDLAREQPGRLASMVRAWDAWFEGVEADRRRAWQSTRYDAPED